MLTPHGTPPHPAPWPPAALRLPRRALDALLQQALARQQQPERTTLLAHAPMVLQHEADRAGSPTPVALAGPLSTQPLRALPPIRAGGLAPVARHGLLLVAMPPPGQVAPQGDAGWEAWLCDTAPGFRLATAALDPAVLVLWLRLDGQGALMYRHGVQPLAGPAGTPAPRWVPVPQLQLPGGGMAQVVFAPPPAQGTAGHRPLPLPAPAEAPEDSASPASRFSVQASAFGTAELRHLQQRRVVLVGAGRVGSVLAHGLVRLGVQNLAVVEPDVMEPHNLDGDMPPLHEGQPKLLALQRFVRGLVRPGAVLEGLPWPVSHPAAGALVAQADVVLVCVDNDAARLWANAWALAHNRCLLAVATSVREQGAELDLRLLPAGTGCLACTGGYAQAGQLLQQLAHEGQVATPADFRQQRRGSLRSWSALAAHMGQRLLEQHLLRQGGVALFRQLSETPQGGLQVRDWRPEDGSRLSACPFCHHLQGAGQAAVTPHRLRALTAGWLAGLAGDGRAAA